MLNPFTTIPVGEPAALVLGDDWRWRRSDLSVSFPTTDWTLTYEFRSLSPAGKFTLTATASGSDYLISVDHATETTWVASDRRVAGQSGYQWWAFLTAIADGKRLQIDAGTMDVQVNPVPQLAGYDSRSYIKKMLDALETVIAGKATHDILLYEIHGKRIEKMRPAEIQTWWQFFRSEYAKELRAEKIRRGIGTPGKVAVRFVDAGSGSPWPP